MRVRRTNPSLVADQLPTIHSTTICVSFCPLILKLGGDIAGIIQLSAEIMQMKLVSTGKKLGCDIAVDCHCCPETFNK
jgi:hypothetical protein